MSKPRMVRCLCPSVPEPHWKLVGDDSRQLSTAPYIEAYRTETLMASPPVGANISAWSKSKGELKCKICGMLATREQLEHCSRPICPSGPLGGFTDIANATASDASWIAATKKMRNSREKTPA